MKLLEQTKYGKDPLRAGIIETFVEHSPVLEILPFINIVGNAYTYLQEEKLPGVAFRGLNAGYTASSGVINPQTEAFKIFGGEIFVLFVS